MTVDVTRDEHQDLMGRVDMLEREVEGEKLVTRHILAETRRNSDDLAIIKARLDRVETSLTQEIRSVKSCDATLPVALSRECPGSSGKSREVAI